MPDFGRVSQIDASMFDAGTAYVVGEEAAARRLRALHLPDARLRPDVDEDRERHRGERLHARRCARIRRARACSTPARSTASTCRSTTANHWQPLSTNLPDTQVSDIWVDGQDIAIATHGRGFYVLDNVDAAAAVRRGGVGDRCASVQAGRRDSRRQTGEHHLLAEETAAESEARDSRRQGTGGALVRWGARPVRARQGGWRGRSGGRGRTPAGRGRHRQGSRTDGPRDADR